MRRPIHDMLEKTSGRVRMHMPGHKGRAPFGAEDLYALDTTELPVTDDFYCADSGIMQAQECYASWAGAGASLFLHNGSTAGIHTMLQLYARPGDTVLLPRNAHLSAQAACVLGDLHPVWMPVTVLPGGHCMVTEETVLEELKKHPEAKTVLITRPDTYGCAVRLDRIAARAHELGIRLVVDEAHGAHFPCLGLEWSAGAQGADAWTQSAHKTLPALTGSAVLHLRKDADREAALRILRREQTSSPSFILLQSIDDARAFAEAYGAERAVKIAERLNALRDRLPEYGMKDAHAQWQGRGMTFDPLRLVIEAPMGGAALDEALRQQGIDVEMHDDRRVVALASIMSETEDIDALEKALERLKGVSAAEIPEMPEMPQNLPEAVMSLREAALSEAESVSFERCAGRVAAAAAGLYPPGVPLVVPGEIITGETAALLKTAGPRRRFGTEGEGLLCVR